VSEALIERIRAAAAQGTALRLRGTGSKDFYGGTLRGEILDLSEWRGIVSYEPTELVITARAGTPIAAVEAALAERGQVLAFEPPRFNPAPGRSDDGARSSQTTPGGTLGGAVAAGLAGPGRARAGAVRDFVLGARIADGTGRILGFGGRVMKNVAGYDVSRLLAGSLGTLGAILEVSLKVLPAPAATATVRLAADETEALALMNRCSGQPLPITASCWYQGALHLRLCGAAAAVRSAEAAVGGTSVDQPAPFWDSLRDQTHPFFTGATRLWRLSLPSTAAAVALDGAQLIEWGGAQRWWATAAEPERVRGAARAAGGHATLFRGADAQERAAGVFQPLPAPLLALHRDLKRAFDPAGILNPGRLYPGL